MRRLRLWGELLFKNETADAMNRKLLVVSAGATAKLMLRPFWLMIFTATESYFVWSILTRVPPEMRKSQLFLLAAVTATLVGWVFIWLWRIQCGISARMVEIEERARGSRTAQANASGPLLREKPVASEDDLLELLAGHRDWERFRREIRVIGEYTTEAGPFAGDWFLVMIFEHEPRQEISIYELPEGALEVLSRRLDGVCEIGLANSAHLNSRILWPIDIVGKPLYRFESIKPGTLSEWFKRLFGLEIELVLTDEARSALAR